MPLFSFLFRHPKKVLALVLVWLFFCVFNYGDALSVSDFNRASAASVKHFHLKSVEKRAYFVDGQKQPSVHAVSALETDNNDLLAVWFAGSREGHTDVTIESARFSLAEAKETQGWQQHQTLMDRETLSSQLGIYIKKLGNPMLVKRHENELWLFFVSVSIGGWATSQVNYMISKDNGASWGRAKQLVLSPLVNISYLIRNKALVDAEGRIWLPLYFELGNHIPEYLVLNKDAEIEGRGRFDQLSGSMQPVFVENIGPHKTGFDVYARPAEPTNIPMLDTSRAKQAHEKLELAIKNPNSGIEVITTNDSLLMLNNPIEAKRSELWLYEKKHFQTWQPLVALELGALNDDGSYTGHEYSYPWMMFDSKGVLHVLYTFQRERIKHVIFESTKPIRTQTSMELLR